MSEPRDMRPKQPESKEAPMLFESPEAADESLHNLQLKVEQQCPTVRTKRQENSLEFILDQGPYGVQYKAERVVVWCGPVQYAEGYEPKQAGNFYVEDSSEQGADGKLFGIVCTAAEEVKKK